MRRSAFILFLLISFCFAVFCADKTKQPSAVPSRPSLSALIGRLDGYWKLLQGEKRNDAALYVSSPDRNEFRSGKTPSFSDPRVKSIELSADGSEATVVVVVKRAFAPLTKEIDWPVTDHWRFEKGNWYVRYDPQPVPMLISKPKSMTPEQTESAMRQVRGKIQFSVKAFNFGTVDQGKDAVLKMKYTLSGADSIPVIFRTSVPGSNCPNCDRQRGISIQGLEDECLQPGTHELTVIVPTWNYDGPVKENFTLDLKALGVHVPYEFTVQGNVYTPLTIIPKELKLKSGDREKEIVLRNNSKSDLQLLKFVSESQAIELEPFPVTVLPGEQLTLKVKAAESLDGAFPNAVDHLAITFTPVDGFAGTSYKIYLNTPKEKKERVVAPTDDPAIQEMIRKNAIIPPNN